MRHMITIGLVILILGTVNAQDYPAKYENIKDWTIAGEKQYFSRDNLYDYINGASDFYLAYDFQDLWVVDYKDNAGRILTLELYRHGSAMQTFGIYTEERPQIAQLLEIGAQGFMESGAIFFLAADYYVKIYNGRPEVLENDFIAFAKAVANRICTACGLPQQFAWFPAEDRIASSERYMSKNFMGITGFNGVCTVEYTTGANPVRLFVFKGDDKQCRAVMSKYFRRLNYKKKIKARTYDLDDPYLGKVKIAYKKGVISGVLDADDPEAYNTLLDALHSAVLSEG